MTSSPPVSQMKSIAVALATSVLMTSASIAGDKPRWNPLWDMSWLPIQIEVGNLSPDAKKAALTKKMIHDVVELGLRRNKIRTDIKWWLPKLSVKVSIIEVQVAPALEPPLFAYEIDFDLEKQVMVGLAHHRSYWFLPVWSRGALGYNGTDSLRSTVRELLSEWTDELSLDWLKAEADAQAALERGDY